MNSSIFSRLNKLEEILSRDENCNVRVVFTDGTEKIVKFYPDFCGYIDNNGVTHETEIERRGWAGEVISVKPDNWRYDGICSMLEALWRPATQES